MAFEYPVELNARYVFFRISTGEVFQKKNGTGPRIVKWPRADGGELTGAPDDVAPAIVVLHRVNNPTPDTHKVITLDGQLNATSQEFHIYQQVVPKTAEELAADALRKDVEQKNQSLAAAVSTLRDWADDAEGVTVTSGNAVNVLQIVNNRLGKFFDHFADMLEVRGGGSTP